MSFPKKDRNFRTKTGKTFPKPSDKIAEAGGPDFASVIAGTLRKAYGGSGRSIKTVMAYTGVGERTVKNWFAGRNAPNGENLVELVRNSDDILEAFLLITGRQEILAAKKLGDARDKLVEMLEIIDALQETVPVGKTSAH